MHTSDFDMMGWPLVRVEDEPAPRVSHIVLAERFGMTRHKTARELIERNREEFERYGQIICRRTVRHQSTGNGGEREFEADELLLNEGHSLLFGTLARTPKAADVREGLIRLYMFFREIVSTALKVELDKRIGGIETAIADARLMAARACNQTSALAVYVQENIGEGGTISATRFNKLWADLRTLADVEVRVGKWTTRRAAIADIQREMRDAVEWGGKGQPWNEMSSTNETAVRAVLRRRMKDATRRPKGAPPSAPKRATTGQESFDFNKPN